MCVLTPSILVTSWGGVGRDWAILAVDCIRLLYFYCFLGNQHFVLSGCLLFVTPIVMCYGCGYHIDVLGVSIGMVVYPFYDMMYMLPNMYAIIRLFVILCCPFRCFSFFPCPICSIVF